MHGRTANGPDARQRQPGFWRALAAPTSSRALGATVLGLWLLVHAIIVARAALPDIGLGRGPFPWHMFASASAYEMSFQAEARAPGGAWLPLPVERLFHYRRGATELRVYDQARQLLYGGHQRERQQFARFIAARLADALPARANELRMRYHLRHRDTGAGHFSELGSFAIEPP